MAHLLPASILIAALLPLVLVGGTPATRSEAATTRAQQAKTMKIRMDVNGSRVTATLEDNETSRDFISLLPLTLTLEDYNGTEKISNLAKKLSTKGAPDGVDARAAGPARMHPTPPEPRRQPDCNAITCPRCPASK